jgi:hypothetical protein
LAGKSVIFLPEHFTAVMGAHEPYFIFRKEHEMKEWEVTANIIWSEYIMVLKEYYVRLSRVLGMSYVCID